MAENVWVPEPERAHAERALGTPSVPAPSTGLNCTSGASTSVLVGDGAAAKATATDGAATAVLRIAPPRLATSLAVSPAASGARQLAVHGNKMRFTYFCLSGGPNDVPVVASRNPMKIETCRMNGASNSKHKSCGLTPNVSGVATSSLILNDLAL
jgi:hypothetical protein